MTPTQGGLCHQLRYRRSDRGKQSVQEDGETRASAARCSKGTLGDEVSVVTQEGHSLSLHSPVPFLVLHRVRAQGVLPKHSDRSRDKKKSQCSFDTCDTSTSKEGHRLPH